MVKQIDLLLEKLQGLYNRAVSNEVPRYFFLALYEFLENYDQSPLLKPIIKSMVDKGKEDTKILQGYEEKALKEMEEVYKEIKDYVEKNGIVHAGITEHLDTYKAYDENRIQSTAGPVGGRHGSLAFILMCLAQDKSGLYRPFAQKFGKLREDGFIEEWTFAPSYLLWNDEKKKVERLQITTLWYSWDKLAFFHDIYKNFEEIRKDRLEKNEVFTVIGLNMVYEELNSIMSYKQDTKRYLREFDVGNYRVHLERVFAYTKELLAMVDESIPVQDKFSYDSNKGKLTANDKNANFKKESFRAQLLSLLTKSKQSLKRKWSWDEVYEAIEGQEQPDNPTKYKRKLYYACKGLNAYVADKTGMTNFLVFDTNYAQINPSYL